MGNKDSKLKEAAKAPITAAALVTPVAEKSLMSIDDFEVLKVIGRGSFGKVLLAKKKINSADPNKLFAIKILKKLELYKRDQITHTETERYILEKLASPFLIKLHYAFQDKNKLYFVLDFMMGGEMYRSMQIKKKFDEATVALCAAELCCGLEVLHANDIIYRDLKPENIMIDADGHVCLIDFGMAKRGVKGSGEAGDAKTFCGTPEYLAPEIISKVGYGKAADWWALGSIVFELLTGQLPFYHQNVDKMYGRICSDPLVFPKIRDSEHYLLSEQAMVFIRGLLTKSITGRLGSALSSSIDAIKESAFLARFDFDLVLRRQYKSNIAPEPIDDLSKMHKNFDSEFTQESIADSYDHRKIRLSIEGKVAFPGFEFIPNLGVGNKVIERDTRGSKEDTLIEGDKIIEGGEGGVSGEVK